MAVWALGINHTTAPLDLRGRFAFALDQVAPTLSALRDSVGGQLGRPPEAALLSTCNRTEIYCAGAQHDIDSVVHWLAQSGGVAPGLLRSHAYTLQDAGVARPPLPGAGRPRPHGARGAATPSAWGAASTRWCSGSRRSSAR